MDAVIEWLNDIPFAGLMLVVALGFSLGKLEWKGLALGPAGGTILVALVLGHLGISFDGYYGVENPPVTIGAFGFCLFIYSVGFEAGPRFVGSLLSGSGWRFVLVGTIVNVVAFLLAIAAGRLLELDAGVTAGLLAGSLTSAPTYAAAAEVAVGMRDQLALTFAITYPIGLAAVVLMVQFLPRLMRDDLAKDLEEEDAYVGGGKPGSGELTRAFEVKEAGVLGPTLKELDLTHRTGCYIVRLHRGDDIRAVDADTVLEESDHVLVRGRFEELQAFEALVGPEVYDEQLRQRLRRPRLVRVTQKAVAGKTLKELDLARRHRCLIQAVDRGGVQIEPAAELALQRGDIAHVVGRRDPVRAVAAELGRFERSGTETDIAIYAGGIFLGVMLGSLKVALGGWTLTLGFAGGLLLVGVLLGRFRHLGVVNVNVPRAARQLVRDLGILLLVAEAGVQAGSTVKAGFLQAELAPALLSCLVITVLSVALAVWLGRRLLGMRPIDAWGSLGGGMTSSAALAAVKRASMSNEAALSYAAAYAVASVLATIAGQLIVVFL